MNNLVESFYNFACGYIVDFHTLKNICLFVAVYFHIYLILCRRIWEYFYDPDYGNCYTFTAKTKNSEILQARKVDFWQEENGKIMFFIFNYSISL